MNSHPDPTLPFAIEAFEANQSEILLRMGEFFLSYLKRLRQAFNDDITTAIVLGEIGHHNAAGYYCPRKGLRRDMSSEERIASMPCCNAHSLSESTGIPRETVRRKIDALVSRGWIEKVEGRGMRITPACVEHFATSFNVPTLAGLLDTARAINHILSAQNGHIG